MAMNEEQLLSVMQDIATIKEGLKSVHRRIDKSDALTSRIHDLAMSIETLSFQLKNQNDRIKEIFEGFDIRMKSHGDRIGALERKPAKRWENAVSQIISIVIAAVTGVIIAKFM